MPGSTVDRLAARAFLDSLWDLTARALLAGRSEDAAAFANEAEGWLRYESVNELGPDERAVWTQRFAASRRPSVAADFEHTPDREPTDPYRETSFVAVPEASPLLVEEVACTSGYTRLTWSRSETSPDQALADAHSELNDDIGTGYLPLDSGGGSGSDGRYIAFSRFAPAIPPEATKLGFRTGEQTARLLRRVAQRI